MKFLNNITGLFVGNDSKKRQIGMFFAGVALILNAFGYLDPEQFKAIMVILSAWIGVAFSMKLTKIGKAIKK